MQIKNKIILIGVTICLLQFSCDKSSVTSSDKDVTTDNNSVNDTNIEDNNKMDDTTGNTTDSVAEATIVYEYPDDINTWTADDYNRKGLETYGQGDYEIAEANFQKACGLDSNHPWANFNLACVLALKYANSSDPNRNSGMIFHHLILAISEESSIAERAQNDSDFTSIKELDRFKFITKTPGFINQNSSNVKYVKYDTLDEYNRLVFEDEDGNMFSFTTNQMFEDLGLITLSGMFYQENSEKLGNTYTIDWKYKVTVSEYTGYYYVDKEMTGIKE